jgi:hypothetical protein
MFEFQVSQCLLIGQIVSAMKFKALCKTSSHDRSAIFYRPLTFDTKVNLNSQCSRHKDLPSRGLGMVLSLLFSSFIVARLDGYTIRTLPKDTELTSSWLVVTNQLLMFECEV